MKKIIVLLTIVIILASCNNQNPQKIYSKNIELVNQYFEHFNNHDWKKIAEIYSEIAEFKDPSLGEGIVKQTREEIVEKDSELNGLFPDINDEVIEIYPSGEKHIIVEFISRGTAPDGLKFELPICTIFKIKNGQIIKDFSYFDNFEE